MTTIARHKSELHPQFLSNNSMDPWVDVNSAPRKVMFAGHLPQSLVISGSEERYWQTGTEKRFGEYCFSVKAPSDIEINRVIDRFPKSRVYGSSIQNSQTIVIFTDLKTRQVGCLDLREFSLEHQYFGFQYKKTEAYHKITKGACFEEGTEFLVSPSIKQGGGYGYGVNLLFATMSHPAVSEDGILISESALKKMSFDMIETRVASWGQNRYGLNLFGDDNNYKIFKDVGEKIRPDGLLMATREFDERLSVTSMGIYDTQMLDMTYDDKLYTRAGDGTIVDIMVYHDNRSLPNGMNAQVEHYKELTDRFYRDILDEYNRLNLAFDKKMKVSDEFHRLVLEACAMTDYDIGDVVQKLYHKAPIDDWRVEFKIKYTVTPNIGNKATGCAGDKGVVCHVLPDSEMPINDYGVRVECVMSPESPFNRQNFGGLYEQYFNQVTRDFLTDTRERLSFAPEEKPTEKEMLADMQKRPDVYNDVWNRLTRLYEILSPTMHENYTSPKFDSDEWRATHLSWKMKYPCLHILSPTNNMTAWRPAVEACEAEFAPRVSPVTYRGYSGNWVRTKKPVEIGHKYFMLLEKISDDWIAVSTAKTQHLQVLGQVTSSDKYSNPAKTQAVKAISEAELRIILSNCGGPVAADLLDRNNSLATHREYVYSLLDSDTPTNIERGVDRSQVPLGNNRALKLFKHILDCNGYKFVFKKYVDPSIQYRDTYVDKSREHLFVGEGNIRRIVRNVKNTTKRSITKLRTLFSKKEG
jgi:hypothetical protein